MRPHASLRVLLLWLAIVASCESPDGYDPGPQEADEAGLWTVSGDPAQIARLLPAQLEGTGAREPAHTLTTTSATLGTVAGVAFAADGTLWVTSLQDSALLAFAPATLDGVDVKPADIILRSVDGSLAGPVALAFDRSHGLWVSNHDNGTVAHYDARQLATSGSPRPTVVLTGALAHPTGLALDARGALWVSDNVANTIVRYDPDQLTHSGSPAPAAMIVITDRCFAFPSGLAFDPSGSLWVANAGCEDLLNIHVESAGPPATWEKRSIHLPAGSFGTPVGVAIDADGDLWVLGFDGSLTQLAQADLRTTDTPVPAARLSLAGRSLLWSLAFWPRPAALSNGS